MGSSGNIDQQLQELMGKYGFVRPDRGNLDAQAAPWRLGKPDYRNADLQYFKGKTMNHKAGSLELLVENLVKKWEMEATHLPDYKTWTTINADKYHVQSNGQKILSGEESSKVGTYNWLLSSANKELYDSEQHTFESSHSAFRGAFTDGFPWELLQVFSGPPKVTFTWRHWARFSGEYKGRVGEGQLCEMHGFAAVEVDDQLRICKLEIYSKPDAFLEALEGKRPTSQGGKDIIGSGCPFHQDQ